MTNTDNRLIVLTESELEDVIYRAANKATSSLYDGLAKRFMYQFEDDIRTILFELEEMNR